MTDLNQKPTLFDGSFKQIDLNQIQDFEIPAIMVHDQSYDVRANGIKYKDNSVRSDNDNNIAENTNGNCFSP
jgi:hypothetical protein